MALRPPDSDNPAVLLMNHFIQCVFLPASAEEASGLTLFVCDLIGCFLSLLSVTSQARKAEFNQSQARLQIADQTKNNWRPAPAHAFLF
jgi:hypothetical protein